MTRGRDNCVSSILYSGYMNSWCSVRAIKKPHEINCEGAVWVITWLVKSKKWIPAPVRHNKIVQHPKISLSKTLDFLTCHDVHLCCLLLTEILLSIIFLQTLHQMKHLQRVWGTVLPRSVFTKAMATLVNTVLMHIVEHITVLEVSQSLALCTHY